MACAVFLVAAWALVATGPALAQVWTYGFDVEGLYDTNTLRDPEALAIGGFGTEMEAVLDFQNRSERPTLFLRIEPGIHRFTQSDERDYYSLRLRSAYRYYVSRRWEAELAARLSIGVITSEYLLADQGNVIASLRYDPGYHNLYSLYVSYRRRVYRDEFDTGAHSPYAIATYRRRFGSWHYLDFEGWFERNLAELDHRTFYRTRAIAEYTRPLTEHDRVRVGLQYQHQPYDDFQVDGGGSRLDRRLWGHLFWIRDLWHPTNLYVGYEYRTRWSNAEDRDYLSHRVTIMIRARW